MFPLARPLNMFFFLIKYLPFPVLYFKDWYFYNKLTRISFWHSTHHVTYINLSISCRKLTSCDAYKFMNRFRFTLNTSDETWTKIETGSLSEMINRKPVYCCNSLLSAICRKYNAYVFTIVHYHSTSSCKKILKFVNCQHSLTVYMGADFLHKKMRK